MGIYYDERCDAGIAGNSGSECAMAAVYAGVNHREDYGFTWYFLEGMKGTLSALTQRETPDAQTG